MKKLCTILAALALVVLCIALLPTEAKAAKIIDSGTCGTNVTWVLDSDGVLTISGTGPMSDYSSYTNAPWYSLRNSIKTVTIKNGVTSIGRSAFDSCDGLTSITIPDSVTSIGGSAFYDCDSLTSITIPDSVTSIGNYAFAYCTSLTSITIPDSVTSIADYAFYDCTSLISITIPNSVTSIGDYAFYRCTSLTSVTIPDSVTSIGNYAFAYCTSLTSVTIPDSVTSIGDWAFCYCTSLRSMTIPDGVTSIGNYAFAYCTSLTSITIPDSVTSIGNVAFDHCTSLTSITIPDSVTSIGNVAFSNCDNLNSVYIYDVVAWSQISFGDAKSNPLYYANLLFLNDELVTKLVIPEGVTQIKDYAFYSCYSIKEVVLPESIESVGRYAFYECRKLQTAYYKGSEADWNAVTISGGNTYLRIADFMYTYTENTAAHEHLLQVVTPMQRPTCTEDGYTSAQRCVNDGCNYAVASELWKAFGHSYANGFCTACGAADPSVPQDLVFQQTPSLSFQDYIGMQVMISNADVAKYDKVYVIAVQEGPDGSVETRLEGIPFYGVYQVFDQQVLSWSMTEKVTLTLYGEKNGIVYEGQSISASVAELAMTKLETYKAQSNTKACRALVDMLNYGAAVQLAFNYNTENLPSAGDYVGSTNTPSFDATNGKTGAAAVSVLKDSISMQAKVEIQMLFAVDISAYTPKATVGGKDAPVVIDTETMGDYGWTLVRVAIGAVNMRDTYTIALYDADGNPVTQVYEVSVEAYGKTQLTSAYRDVVIAMMRYGDSVAAL